jgi:DNA-binding MarR family transcriptional regulator
MTEPRWLTDDEQRAWRALLAMNLMLEEELDRQLRRDAGMPHAYYQILAMLSEAPNRVLRMSELARITGFSPSRLSHAVAKLEDSGLVVREPCDEDCRGFWAVLTDHGHEILAAAAPGHVAMVRHLLFDRLTPTQIEQLRRIAERARTAVDSDRFGGRFAGRTGTNRRG